jgi:uncharacterized caspase-like protein
LRPPQLSQIEHLAALTNPRNDAADMSTGLKQRGFQAIQGLDLDKVAFDERIREFATALSNADVGLFFYAGHGLQVAGQNYLVPTDAKLEAPVEPGVGTLISFSTQLGNVAFDGVGRNSPFSAALVKYISASNEDLSEVLIGVRRDVMNTTQNRQVPWEHTALTARYYFN